MTQKAEFGQILIESQLAPKDRGKSYIGFYNQFVQALNQSGNPQPQIIEGDPLIFGELHSAAHRASEILKANCGLLHAMKSRLLRVKEMTSRLRKNDGVT